MQPSMPMFTEDALIAGAASDDESGASDRWRALARIVTHALRSSDEGEVTGRVAEGLLRLFDGETVTLFRSGATEVDVLPVASAGRGPTESAHAPDVSYALMTRAIKERRAVAGLSMLGAVAVLAVPLRGRDRVVGAMTMTHRLGVGLTPLDIEIAETFADQTAASLELIWGAAHRDGSGGTQDQAQKHVIEAERLRAVGQLAGGVAHHLNNIMTVILGNIHVALGEEASVGLRTPLQSAERAVLEAADVVRRMSAFSRVGPVAARGVVDLNLLATDVLEWTRSRWQTEAQLRGITIETRLDPGDVPAVPGDETGLREVLLNLVLNAIDAVPDGGSVVVRTWRGDTSVYCSVADNGVGMAVETTQRALEPFFTTKGPQSRGLGLSVAYGIVQRHSGSLAIESRKGRGSTVTFSLPISSRGAASHRECLPGLGESPRVLVIDDDAPVRTVLRALLARDGYTVVEAAGGRDALEQLARGDHFDLVLADLVMPDVNGWEVLRGARRLKPGLPVVLITGWDQIRPEGDDAPDAVVMKPITDVELRDTVAGVLGRQSPPWRPCRTSGDATRVSASESLFSPVIPAI